MRSASQAPGGEPFGEGMIAACDPNIRQVVRWLNVHGFETTDSGDGRWKWLCDGCGAQPGERHGTTKECGRRSGKVLDRAEAGQVALDYAHVYITVEPAHAGIDAAERLARELRLAGVVVVQIGEEFAPGSPAGAWIQLTYDPVTESAMIELMHLDDEIFRRARASFRADVPR